MIATKSEILDMDQSEHVSTNSSCSIRLLFIILLIPITIYIIKTNFVLNYIVPVISINQSFITNPPEQRIRCIVYVKHCHGRLGNQMFIFASGYGLARLHSCHLYVSPEIIHKIQKAFIFNVSSSLLLSSLLHLPNGINITSMNRTTRHVGCQYLPELTRPNGIPQKTIFELTGYWQSYLHFEKYGDELREHIFVPTQKALMNISAVFVNLYQEKFGVRLPLSSDDHQLLKKQLAQSNLATWIGMHVRRSDFKGIRLASSDEYLFSAIQYYTSLYSNAHILVASDDKPYCKNLFRNYSNIFFTPQSFSPGEDLIALSVCQHSIVTGGTFSWWAAYLTNGQVVHDKIYRSGCERREQYYPPWFLIDGKVPE